MADLSAAGGFSGISAFQLYPPGSAAGATVDNPTTPVVSGAYQPNAIGRGHILATLFGLIIFLIVVRVVYEVTD